MATATSEGKGKAESECNAYCRPMHVVLLQNDCGIVWFSYAGSNISCVK